MANILPITTHPNPILRKISEDVNRSHINTDEMRKLMEDMALTMKEKDGIGLAAPQVGKNIRMIVINSEGNPVCMINPEITKRSWRMEPGEEGCLSVPDQFGKVSRHKKIKYKYINDKGMETQGTANDMDARVIQHEIDHLDGILFIDKVEY